LASFEVGGPLNEMGKNYFSLPELIKETFSFEAFDKIQDLATAQNTLVNLKGSENLLTVQAMGLELQTAVGKGTPFNIGEAEPFYQMPKEFNFKPYKPTFQGASYYEATNLKAGVFEYEGKRIGFLRIPSYQIRDLVSANLGLKGIIKYLNENSDVLLIDQTSNPGGMVMYSDMIIKGLVGEIRRDSHMRFAFRPGRSIISTFQFLQNQLNSLQDIPELVGLKSKYDTAIETELSALTEAFANDERLTRPVSLSIVSELMIDMLEAPLKVKMTQTEDGKLMRETLKAALGFDPIGDYKYEDSKPIIMMINELDISGGDATPAVLQDYGRVKMVGVNTAGAGGSVGQFGHDLRNQFSFTATQSLMIRKDGGLVENIGVAPDIDFQLKKSDVTEQFVNVLPRLMQTLKDHKAL
ncbi:MAG: hypothetical protein KDD22_06420, partial [Bdellovibrionales bacterium]|nr:hypothetical protein [Bdellovibrionales bacterium]